MIAAEGLAASVVVVLGRRKIKRVFAATPRVFAVTPQKLKIKTVSSTCIPLWLASG
jgi:hypothetical protein